MEGVAFTWEQRSKRHCVAGLVIMQIDRWPPRSRVCSRSKRRITPMAVANRIAMLGVFAIGANTFVPDRGLPPGERTPAIASLAGGWRPFTGLYLGISQDGAAWLVRLDSDSPLSALYDPLESIALCEVKVDSSDHIWFRSAETDGSTIRFAGVLS